MTQYYYVSSVVGTNTTTDAPETTPLTIAFSSMTASNVYPTIQDCTNNAAFADEDWILLADNHSEGSATHINILNLDTGIRINIMSVLNTSAEQYSRGARLNPNSPYDIIFQGANNTFNVRGVNFDAGGDIILNAAGQKVIVDDADFHTKAVTSGYDMPSMSGDGQSFTLRNAGILCGHLAHGIRSSESKIIFDNVSAAGSHTKITNLLKQDTSNNGGIHFLKVFNSDLASILAVNGNIAQSPILSAEQSYIEIHRCKMPSGWDFFEATPGCEYWEAHATECDVGDGYYYFRHESEIGKAQFDSASYLNATYDGTNGFSAQLTSLASCNAINPLRYELCSFPAQNLNVSGGIDYQIEFTSSVSDLDGIEVYFEVVSQDATDQALGVLASDQEGPDLAAGTTHTTSGTGTWGGGTGSLGTDYRQTVNVPQKAAATNSTVTIFVCLARPSTVVNFDLPTIPNG